MKGGEKKRFELSMLILGSRRFRSPEEKTRARILADAIFLVLPIPCVDGVRIVAGGIGVPYLSIAAMLAFLVLCIGLRGRLSVQSGGLLFAFALEAAFFEGALLLDSLVCFNGLLVVPFLTVLTSGYLRGAFAMVVPSGSLLFLPTLLRFAPPFKHGPSAPHFVGGMLPETANFLGLMFLLWVIGCTLERLALNIYDAYLAERRASLREMTARKAKERELADSMRLLESLFAAIPVPVFVKDMESHYLRCSDSYFALVDLEPELVIMREPEEIYGAEFGASFRNSDQRVLEQGKYQCFEETIRPGTARERHVLVQKLPYLNADGSVAGILGVILDQTERLEREHKLQSLLETNRGALALLGHDLKNPIGSFRDLVRSIRNDKAIDPQEYRTVLYEMEKSLDSLWRLLDELLDWARSEGGMGDFHPSRFLLAPLVAKAFESVDLRARAKGIALVQELPEEFAVYGDERMVSTLLRNLLANAVKFTGKGGQVTVSAGRFRSGGRDWARFSVADDGIGMPPAALRVLFESGKVSHRLGTEGEPGTGLGLGLCRRLADRHGGSMDIESEEGEGSVFSVFLPFPDDAAGSML